MSDDRRQLRLQPVTYEEAAAYVRDKHRHHIPQPIWKFGVGVVSDLGLHGVVMVGRPVSRALDDGWTLEVSRCCTDSTPHVASKLYAAVWRAARSLGYIRMVTYTLDTELGASLRAAGWERQTRVAARQWDTPSRRRDYKPIRDRWRWSIGDLSEQPTRIRYVESESPPLSQSLQLPWDGMVRPVP
jgi:hypothetical protein